MESEGEHPRVVLGTMTMGDAYADMRSHDACVLEQAAMVREYWERFPLHRGEATIDTARYYRNEAHVAAVVEKARVSVKWSSKANPWAGNDFTSGAFGGLSERAFESQLTASLRHCPALDTYFLHAPDAETSLEETLAAVDRAHRAGRFRQWGLSNFSLEQCERISDICAARGYAHPAVYQGMYNVFCRQVECIFPWIRQHGMSFWAYNPLLGGLVCTSRPSPSPPRREPTMMQRWFNWLWKCHSSKDTETDTDTETETTRKGRFSNPIYQKLFLRPGLVAACASIPPDQGVRMALLWLRDHSCLRSTDAVVLGASSLAQLQENMDVWQFGAPLSEEEVRRLDMAHAAIPMADRPAYFY
ncbi:aldo/keto reductase [bacterium]|nr:aldo/keto reductase [bacterium]